MPRHLTPDDINALTQKTLSANLGIVVTKISDHEIEATLPVTAAVAQPMGKLHGGASCVLIETLGSIAAFRLCADNEIAVGVELNASHLKAMNIGETARGVCAPLKIGKTQQVWDVRLYNPRGDLCCVGRLTTVIFTPK